MLTGDSLEPSGLSELFSSRIGKPVELQRSSGGSMKKEPDRVVGLQQTKNFRKLLESSYAHHDGQQTLTVRDVLRVSINQNNGGEPLLFPFLILEAKSEKGSENFQYMEAQSAIPIQAALKLQYDLMRKPGNAMDVPGGPLVWFFANRGEDWRVYAAHVVEKEQGESYHINHLWGGSITGLDEAFQLLLILDCILDWARDTYRLSILRQLTMLTVSDINDAATFDLDPDAYSVYNYRDEWFADLEDRPGEEMEGALRHEPSPSDFLEPQEEWKQPQVLEHLSVQKGLVSDARYIESRLRGVLITADNFNTLVSGYALRSKPLLLAKQMIRILEDHCIGLENQNILDELEERWTGESRIQKVSRNADEPSSLFAQIRVSYYLDEHWQQVRELNYLALTADVVTIVRNLVGRKRRPPLGSWPTEGPCRAELFQAIDELRGRSVQDDLKGVLTRNAFTLKRDYVRVYEEGGADFVPVLRPRIGENYDVTKRLENSPGLAMKDLVYAIRRQFQIGVREISEPFLRVSSRLDFDQRPLFRKKFGTAMQDDRHRLAKYLVYSGDPDSSSGYYVSSTPKLCLFLIGENLGKVSKSDVVEKLDNVILCEKIHSTDRHSRRISVRSKDWKDNRQGYRVDVGDFENLGISYETLMSTIVDWQVALVDQEDD